MKNFPFLVHPKRFLLGFLVGVFLVLNIASFAIGFNPQRFAQAQNNRPVEPNCTNAATSASWNPYPRVLDLASPDISGGNCRDLPLLSFFPINTQQNNPRQLNIVKDQTVGFVIYYNNGARPNSSGNPKIDNPRVKLQMVKESNTRYRIKATLSGNNVPTVTSADKGGDLIINTPADVSFRIVGDNTLHFIDAIERKYLVETGQLDFPYVRIPDQTTNGFVYNPIWTEFPGQQLPNSGFQIKPQLEAGFLGYGYILGQIKAVSQPAPQNKPPVLPGQEITIIRGESGSFERLNGTDPDNNYPLTYNLSKLPSFCRVSSPGSGQNGPGATGPRITCTTNATTPVRTTFPITPIDSLGLAGVPGQFIVNVVDSKPKMSAVKECFVKGTNTPCAQGKLTLGDKVTYKITVTNTGKSNLQNLTIDDIYEKNKLTDITNISDNGQHNPQTGKILWSLGTLDVGKSKSVTFNATITRPGNLSVFNQGDPMEAEEELEIQSQDQQPSNGQSLNSESNSNSLNSNGEEDDKTRGSRFFVRNVALVKAKDVPNITVKVTFPVYLPGLNASKQCFVKGTNTPCASAKLTPGDTVTYRVNVNNPTKTDVTDLKITDTYDRLKLTDIKNISDKGVHDKNAGKITWQLGTLGAGKSRFVTFDATIVRTNLLSVASSESSLTSEEGGLETTETQNLEANSEKARQIEIINTALVQAKNVPDITVTVKFPVYIPALTASKQCFVKGTNTPCAQGNLKLGDTVTYRVRANNTSPVNVQNLRIVDTYDKVKLSEISNISDNGVHDKQVGTIIWSLGTLDAGKSRFVTFDAKIITRDDLDKLSETDQISVEKDGKFSIINTAIIKSKDLPDISVSVQFPVIVPNLDALKECFVQGTTNPCSSAILQSGSKVTYKVTVTNPTPNPVNNVRIVDTYDRNRLVDITNISNNGVHDATEGKITWQLGTLAGDASVFVTFDATVGSNAKAGEIIENRARITASGVPPVIVKVLFPISGAPLLSTSDKTCVKKGTNIPCSNAGLKPGDSILYSINVRNTGSSVAKNVRVADTYDKEKLINITNINPSGTLNETTGTIVWSVGDVNPSQTVTLQFEATLASTVQNGAIVVNTAVITADNLPQQEVKVQFPVVIGDGGTPTKPQPVTPPTTERTGGSDYLTTSLGLLSLFGVIGFIVRKRSNRFGLRRSQQVK